MLIYIVSLQLIISFIVYVHSYNYQLLFFLLFSFNMVELCYNLKLGSGYNLGKDLSESEKWVNW